MLPTRIPATLKWVNNCCMFPKRWFCIKFIWSLHMGQLNQNFLPSCMNTTWKDMTNSQSCNFKINTKIDIILVVSIKGFYKNLKNLEFFSNRIHSPLIDKCALLVCHSLIASPLRKMQRPWKNNVSLEPKMLFYSLAFVKWGKRG